MSDAVIGPSHESFHTPPTDDPYWTETAWYSFWNAERRLSGALYPMFRPNLGVASCAVYVWDHTTAEPWAVRYGRSRWHLPMPIHDLTELDLAGLRYRCVEPLRRWEVAYTDESHLTVELAYEALFAPHGIGVTSDRGHFDQPGRVSGRVVVGGDDVAIDCLSMRDRSWSVRADVGDIRAGYSYGTVSADTAFHTMSLFAGDHDLVLTGYLTRDGVTSDVISGSRWVEERDQGRPVRVRVEAMDALGRTLETTGACANRLAFQSSPNLFAWMSLTRWDLDGHEAWGEDQDIWSPSMLYSGIP
jgi:hypothetical protein